MLFREHRLPLEAMAVKPLIFFFFELCNGQLALVVVYPKPRFQMAGILGYMAVYWIIVQPLVVGTNGM